MAQMRRPLGLVARRVGVELDRAGRHVGKGDLQGFVEELPLRRHGGERLVVGGLQHDPHALVANHEPRGGEPVVEPEFDDQSLARADEVVEQLLVEASLRVVRADRRAGGGLPADAFDFGVAADRGTDLSRFAGDPHADRMIAAPALVAAQVAAQLARASLPVVGEVAAGCDRHRQLVANHRARQEETAPVRLERGVDGEQIDRPRVPGQRRHQGIEAARVLDEQCADRRLRGQEECPAPDAATAEDQRAIDSLAAAVDAQQFVAAAEVGEQCADEAAVERRVATMERVVQAVPVSGEMRKGVAGEAYLPGHAGYWRRLQGITTRPVLIMPSRAATQGVEWRGRCRSRGR
ncbi:MAG: hypothetical protein NFW15_07830 [Candidatus Accumulibacter sp.]|nr:hypothetical protein [Accumulibacter sp.]MCM8611974.1 hypothetical protein [Accumulibacter sp.]MCM8635834.1 hypothetical protein [Accumulibacter sp.]MCM8641940.1 hypothetical protein [Accumulibacter sp.]